ncbi:hypothetical protein [Simplicispira lacusdiani]|uniref:hypothetical protein n=1 Tax=Simplicispira lacusdiani TaxID=2213010 RepID=UPI0013008599|nr:hypothetical protein [Simplicispira lacusdiani]
MAQSNTEEKSLKVSDIRMLRPFVVLEKKSNMSVVIQQTETFSVENCKISFFTPNNVSLFVSISHRELKEAERIYKSLIHKAFGKKNKMKIKGRNLTRLYNYFEHIQSSIIAIYTAIESLANIAIPHSYKLERKNNKGVTELWDKESIERWYKTSEKISDIVPGVLEIDSPKKLPLWQKFKELEDIRNEIIHQKTAIKSKTDVDSRFLARLLQPTIFSTIKSGFDLISYFCSMDKSHAYFPLGFGVAHVKPEEVDDFGDTFEKIEDD